MPFQNRQSVIGRRLDNADFESSKTRKPIDDTLYDLIGISVKDMVLILVSYSISSRKVIVDCGM